MVMKHLFVKCVKRTNNILMQVLNFLTPIEMRNKLLNIKNISVKTKHI